MKKLQPYFIFILSALFACTGADEGSFDSLIGWEIEKDSFDSYVEEQAKELDIPGLSLIVINDGVQVHRVNYGFADVANQVPVSDQTIFEAASISKPVFAYFVMKFVDEGKLDLDRPLYEYYPHPDLENEPWSKLLTARLILSHQSGLPNWREDDPDQILRFEFEPGTGYGYSGEAYQYLAEVLREIENTDWDGLEAVFQAKVAQPLDMAHTVFIQNEYTRANKAQPYDLEGNLIEWKNDYWFQKNDSIFVAPASVHSEPEDFGKWMTAIMNREGLSEEAFESMLTRQVDIPDAPFKSAYTLGFVSVDLPSLDIIMHTGNNEGFTSYFLMDTSKKWGYVLFTNSEYGEELGLLLLTQLITGPKIKVLFALAGILLLGLTIGIFYGIYRLIKFVLN